MSKENLQNREAIEKLKEMADHIGICMLSVFPEQQEYPHTVPMTRQEIDEEGTLWFLFSSESELYYYLLNNKKVSLTFADVRDYSFLTVNGTAEILRDEIRINKYWDQFAETWFNHGKENPNIRVLKVAPTEAHYWDNKAGKLMTLLKMAASAITGKAADIGSQGDLDIK